VLHCSVVLREYQLEEEDVYFFDFIIAILIPNNFFLFQDLNNIYLRLQ
jgi:hypothetical protein